LNFKTGFPYRSVFTFLIFFTFIYPSLGQDPLVIKKIGENIVFDGLPFEDIWNEVEPFPVVMFQPNFGQEPTEKTEIRLCYNDQYLFLSGRLYDMDPLKIKSTTKKRDDFGGNSDGFGIILDTFDDNENALLFATTPLGLRSDFMIFNDAVGRMNHMPFNISWNTFWDVKTVINKEGWFVEIRIPISSMRFQDIDGVTTMGLIVWRSIPHKNETIIFPAIHPKYGIWAMMKPSQAQKIVFNSIKPEKPIYIAPYALSGISEVHELNEEETAYIKDNTPTLEGGLDVKYGLTSNLTLDITLNTDFAQVEADDEQVNLTRFSLFFPEKRLFFQERSSNFSFNLGGPSNLFYSRSIGIYDEKPVRIYGGARIVGRAGKWDIGLLDMQTSPVWERDSTGQKQKVLPSENFGVLRIRRQVINPNSYVGGILTSRMGTNGSYNYAYGLDGIFRLFGDDYLDVKWAQSFETDSLNDPLSLKPSRIRLSWERRTEEGPGYDFSFSWSGEHFNPGMGFQMRENYYMGRGQIQYGWLSGENSKLYSHKIFLSVMKFNNVEDLSLESASIGPGWSFQTKNSSIGNFRINYNIEDVKEEFTFPDEAEIPDAEIPMGRYDYWDFRGLFITPMTKSFYTIGMLDVGQFYDGTRFSITLRPTWNISSSFELSGMYQLNRLDFKVRDQEYTSHISRFKLMYMFSTKLSASIFIQYNSEVDAIITNFRLRFNPREGNDLYLVFNEGRNTRLDREVPALPSISDRTILVKYTYTFNL